MPMAQDPERVAEGFRATAGPVFSRRGYLLFCDLPDRIVKWERGKTSVVREKSNGARALTFDHQGRLLACEQDRVTRTEKNGALTVLAKVAGNDLVYAIDGSIYVAGAAAWQITRQGQAREFARETGPYFGVALAPDQQRMYLASGKGIFVCAIADDGALGAPGMFAERAGTLGIKTDETGAVWVAGAGGIAVLTPGGEQAAAPLADANNLNWGEGFRNLYVTGGTAVYRVAASVNGTRTY